jgi:two-component system sensor histidine kinase UhpB
LPVNAVAPEAREQLRAGLQQLTQLTHGTLESIRTLALQLRPAVLDDLGLLAALRWLAEDCRERLHLSVDLQLAPLPAASLPPLYETTLFRVAQESLTNVARHAHASAVMIELASTATQVTLRIQDNGQGYAAAPRSAGLGVRGMRERLELLNGSLELRTEPGQGTTVLATLPLSADIYKEEQDA